MAKSFTGHTIPGPEQPFEGKIGRTAKESTPDFPKGIEAPKGAPNVLLILTDDVGFGASSTFGGPIQTPNFQRLADNGLRYNTFHTTALCSPSRAALITGRNHHSVASGVITEMATGYPGYNSLVPKSAGSLGAVLKGNGYEAAGITPPEVLDGVEQKPIEGTSLVYTFDNAKAPTRRPVQYFELVGNRAIYKNGWMASTTPLRLPWMTCAEVNPDDFKWELYNINEDFSQANDLAAQQAEVRLRALQSARTRVPRRIHGGAGTGRSCGACGIQVRGRRRRERWDCHAPCR